MKRTFIVLLCFLSLILILIPLISSNEPQNKIFEISSNNNRDMFVDKYVSYDCSSWVQNLTTTIGSQIWWNITIHYVDDEESMVLYNILINDDLPQGLTYLNNSALLYHSDNWFTHITPIINGSILTFDLSEIEYPGQAVLLNGEWLSVSFQTKIGFNVNENSENSAFVSARLPNQTMLFGNASATISIEPSVWVDDDFSESTPGWQIDHFDQIQEGINAASENGTIYVYNGTYNENVNIQKSIRLIGENNNNTIIAAVSNNAAFHIVAENVLIDGFKVYHNFSSYPAIYCLYDNITISNNIINSKDDGVRIHPADSSKLHNIAVINNRFDSGSSGIFVFCGGPSSHSLYNLSIIKNTFYNKYTGVEIHFPSNYECRDAIIIDNDFFNCGMFFIQEKNNDQNLIVANNKVNGKPLLFLENQSDDVINFPCGQIILLRCTNITIFNQNIHNTSVGLQIVNSNNCNVYNCNISEESYGIMMYLSKNSTYKNNSIDENIVGIYAYGSHNLFLENKITNNSYEGLTIAGNQNILYHNSFINNSNHVTDYDETTLWNGPYQIGGNYWDDYNGSDLFKGPNQDIPGQDGIGDNNYTIDSIRIIVDKYPLMQPWNGTPLPIPDPEIVYVDDDYDVSSPGWQ